MNIKVLAIATPLQYGAPSYGEYKYPPLAVGMGWLLATICFLPLPIIAIYYFTKHCVTYRRAKTQMQVTKDADDGVMKNRRREGFWEATKEVI